MVYLKTDYKNSVYTGDKKYRLNTNSDGTVTMVDVTDYTVKGDMYGASDINETNVAINELSDYQDNMSSYLHNHFPVGSIIVLGRGITPPNSDVEQWELIDKKFAYQEITGFITNSNATSTDSTRAYLTEDVVLVRYNFTTKKVLNDDTVQLGTINANKIGIATNSIAGLAPIASSDGGNGFAMLSVSNGGVVNSNDVVTKASNGTIPTGSSMQTEFTIPVSKDKKLDNFCDRFIWKRVS